MRFGMNFVRAPALFGAICLAAAAIVSSARADSIDCLINPSMTLKIGSPITTTLASVDVDRGDHVTRGQVLARLDSAVEAADLALADARAKSTAEIDRSRSKEEFAAADLSRADRLLQTGNIPPQKAEEARMNFRVAHEDRVTAELNQHLADLELTRAAATLQERIIRSPVDGIVTQRLLGPGEYVHQDSPILIIAVIAPLYVEVYPPVRLWDHIHPGDKARVTMAEPVGATATATVTVVDQVFDAASGTFGVRLDLANPDGKLPAGQRCTIQFGDSDGGTSH